MTAFAYPAALVLAGVFVAAGFSKLRRLDVARESFRSLGLPRWAAPLVACSELTLAALLVLRPALGATVAIGLLAVFGGVLVSAIARGVAGVCGCFGGIGGAPVSFVDVVRNGMLGVLAVAALPVARPTAPSPEAVVLVTAATMVGAVLVAVLRRIGVPQARLRPAEAPFPDEGPAKDAPAPALFDYRSRVTLIAFTSPGCTMCGPLLPGLAALGRRYKDLDVHVVDEAPATASVFAAFNVRYPPYVVGVDAAGVVRGCGLARTPEELEVIVQESLRASRD